MSFSAGAFKQIQTQISTIIKLKNIYLIKLEMRILPLITKLMIKSYFHFKKRERTCNNKGGII